MCAAVKVTKEGILLNILFELLESFFLSDQNITDEQRNHCSQNALLIYLCPLMQSDLAFHHVTDQFSKIVK